eukprot:6772944-Prymnesium_polylepis.1
MQQSLAPLPVWESKVSVTNRELAGLGCLVSPHGLHGRLELTQTTAVHDFCVSERETCLGQQLPGPTHASHLFSQLGTWSFVMRVARWSVTAWIVRSESFLNLYCGRRAS